MAQVMKYHKYPNGYDWDGMINDGATYDTQRLIRDIGYAVNMQYGPNASGSNIDNARSAFINDYGYRVIQSDHDVNAVKIEIVRNRMPIYMRGQERDNPANAHAWVCDGIKEVYSSITHMIEFISGDYGYYSFSDYGHYPQETGYSYYLLHMNWGWGRGNSNGWYQNDKVTPDIYNFSNKRENLFLEPIR